MTDAQRLVEAFEEAFASLRLEGIEPTEFAKEQARRIAAGETTFDAAITEACRRYMGDSNERLERLRTAIHEGLESGEGRLLEDVTTDDIIARGAERLRKVQSPPSDSK